MTRKLQFAFLGPQHSYVATLTSVGSAGYPLDDSILEFYGLPTSFCDQYETETKKKKKYIANVRGHDFLAYLGQCASTKGSGVLDTSDEMYHEIKELQKLAQEEKALSGKKANLITSFGPSSSSFFADAFRIKRYRWANLPADLENEIQKQAFCSKYGKIYDVAINAAGGWIMQLDRGVKFLWGGPLPEELRLALLNGKQRRTTISRVFLNHQHPTEYVLLFNDGQAFARLHQDFKIQLQRLVQEWAKSSKITFEWNFVPSCLCSKEHQQQRNADYYRRRGLFHLSRGNGKLAYEYLKEANRQDPSSTSVQVAYVRALVALRQLLNDPVLEAHLGGINSLRRAQTASSTNSQMAEEWTDGFRFEYLRMLGSREMDIDEAWQNNSSPINELSKSEWSYSMARGLEDSSLVEIDSSFVVNHHDLVGLQELPAGASS